MYSTGRAEKETKKRGKKIKRRMNWSIIVLYHNSYFAVSNCCTERNTCRAQIPNSVMRIETDRGYPFTNITVLSFYHDLWDCQLRLMRSKAVIT